MSAAERFCEYQRQYNGVSETRVRETGRVLASLEQHSGHPAEETTAVQFRKWMQSLSAAGAHPNTVRKKGNMVRPFFRWAKGEGLLDAERLLALIEVRNPRGATADSKPKPYTRKEVARMWLQLGDQWPGVGERWVQRYATGKSPYRRVYRHGMGLQVAAVVHLCLHAGMRREEVFRLDLDTLHPDNAYILVTGAAKGTGDLGPRMREVPFTVELRRALAEWLEFRALMNPGHDCPWLVLNPRANPNGVIPSHPAAPMNFDRFGRLLTDLGTGWEMHRLRHTFATEMLRAGMPIENLKELLGHSRIQQTLAYAKIVPRDNERHMRRAEDEFTRALGRVAREAA